MQRQFATTTQVDLESSSTSSLMKRGLYKVQRSTNICSKNQGKNLPFRKKMLFNRFGTTQGATNVLINNIQAHKSGQNCLSLFACDKISFIYLMSCLLWFSEVFEFLHYSTRFSPTPPGCVDIPWHIMYLWCYEQTNWWLWKLVNIWL